MARTAAIGHQNFGQVVENNYFYVDKTMFIKEWWENGDMVTLITRPRRFGKTLNMSMAEQFFSVEYAGRQDLFEGLKIWEEKSPDGDYNYRKQQGQYPVISISFANVKERDYISARKKICQLIADVYAKSFFLLEGNVLSEEERAVFLKKNSQMDDVEATLALQQLSSYLSRYYGKKVIILLDEYDTPMQEAYMGGYWQELVSFIRNLFNATFKTNPYLERAIMTGITRISKESVFSDLNNLEVVTTTSCKYETAFGFTEDEVFAALEEYGMSDRKDEVKNWYDGFVFGCREGIYNPWSVLNFLDKGKAATYWANTSSNSLVGKLLREGSRGIKESFERLLTGEHLFVSIDEQIVYNQLDSGENAIWSLLVAGGYLRVAGHEDYGWEGENTSPKYELAMTNLEVKIMFKNMVKGWFSREESNYNDFVRALLAKDVEAMNEYMNRVVTNMFSYFDTGKRPSKKAEPERFYHGFVLGLMVELEDMYAITSNRESGFGRYDIMLEPKKAGAEAYILEFKVRNPRKEASLEDSVNDALLQIEQKGYERSLLAKGIPAKHIRKYGFAFEGKEVLIG